MAAATARAILALRPDEVTLVVTGERLSPRQGGEAPEDPGDEDWACAEYLAALLKSQSPDSPPYLERTRRSLAAEKFLDPARTDFPLADLECCLGLDRFSFAMRVQRQDGLLIMQRDR